ncbi:metal-dependent hydrolase [Flavobacterium sp.]|uniref:metal-dependent hydrolase n=1 Tax=Flavobacterium sp. TaxID=239 RepID=UPI0037512CE4
MDSITHGLLGASVSQLVLGKKSTKKTILFGALIANLPDIDVVFLPFFNEFQKIGVHRGFTHSILFCTLSSVLLAVIFRRQSWAKEIPFLRLLTFTLLSLMSHLMLDIFTPYGTQLFLPFNNTRVALNNITIVDLVYSIPLLIGVLSILNIFKTKTYRNLIFKLCFAFSTSYLLFTLIHKQSINKQFESAFAKKGIKPIAIMTVPVTNGNGKWYGLGKTDTFIYMGELNSYKANDTINFQKFRINDNLLNKIDAELANKMRWFAKNFYVVNEYKGKILFYNLQCDMQGIKKYPNYIAPTAFYFEFDEKSINPKEFKTDFHR